MFVCLVRVSHRVCTTRHGSACVECRVCSSLCPLPSALPFHASMCCGAVFNVRSCPQLWRGHSQIGCCRPTHSMCVCNLTVSERTRTPCRDTGAFAPQRSLFSIGLTLSGVFVALTVLIRNKQVSRANTTVCPPNHHHLNRTAPHAASHVSDIRVLRGRAGHAAVHVAGVHDLHHSGWPRTHVVPCNLAPVAFHRTSNSQPTQPTLQTHQPV